MSIYTTDPNDPRLQHGPDQVGDVFLILPDQERQLPIRPLRHTMVHTKCHQFTRIPLLVAETMAADPKFYKVTYCCHCKLWSPVEEFGWKDGHIVGS